MSKKSRNRRKTHVHSVNWVVAVAIGLMVAPFVMIGAMFTFPSLISSSIGADNFSGITVVAFSALAASLY